MPRRRRPWTRAATLGAAAHLAYEGLAGVALPYSSRLGPVAAAGLFAGGTVLATRSAGRLPPSHDPLFAALDGLFLSAVLAHLSGWPRTTRLGLPWLTSCEGLSGRAIGPYNLVLHASGLAAALGVAENRRGRGWGALVPLVAVPVLRHDQHRDFEGRLRQAHRQPRWWNRRLRRPAA